MVQFTHWRVDPSLWRSSAPRAEEWSPAQGGRQPWWCQRRWRVRTVWSGRCHYCKENKINMNPYNMIDCDDKTARYLHPCLWSVCQYVSHTVPLRVVFFRCCNFLDRVGRCGRQPLAVTGWVGCCSPRGWWLRLPPEPWSPPRPPPGCVYPAPLGSCSAHCGVADDTQFSTASFAALRSRSGSFVRALEVVPVCLSQQIFTQPLLLSSSCFFF